MDRGEPFFFERGTLGPVRRVEIELKVARIEARSCFGPSRALARALGRASVRMILM